MITSKKIKKAYMLQKLSKETIESLYWENKMKFLIIGCGSIGERHIRNLNSLFTGDILAHDIDTDRLRLMKEKYNSEIYYDIEEALDQKPDAVLVCTPPNLHITMAMKAVHRGSHIFIEKPISNDLQGVDKFLAEAEKKKLIVSVGYNFRFHEGIKLMKNMINEGVIGKVLSAKAEFGQYLPDWRPWQNYKESYTARKDLGGGIILDGSHEIDYICWLLGEVKEIFCFADKLSNLDVSVEDTSEILLKFKNDVIVEIHLDFIQRDYSRNCKIIGENGTITWDYTEDIVKLYTVNTKKWKTFPIKMKKHDMYIQEMKHFLDCINGKTKPIVDGITAKKVLEMALAAKKSAETGKVIKL